MSTSVLIPCYNAERTIVAAVESAIAQTLEPLEILVLLDGCTDATAARLARFGSRVRVIAQENQGVACARNRLVAEAKGDVLAFLDADDLWHPAYLSAQNAALEAYPEAVASFTGHVRFDGDGYVWAGRTATSPEAVELLDSVTFFVRYNVTTAVFGSMTYCCVRRDALARLGPEPFSRDLHAVEDSFLCYQLALVGPVAFHPATLAAYRLTAGSLSENRIRNLRRWAEAFRRVEPGYLGSPRPGLARAFPPFYASKRREYAKVLMGAGQVREARRQLWQSIGHCGSLASVAKSAGLLALGALPRPLQPAWPSSVRPGARGSI